MAKRTDLLAVDEARDRLLAHFSRLEPESVNLEDSLFRVLAEPVVSAFSLPPFANSSMDGFALRAADTAPASVERATELDIIATVAAGSKAALPVGPGQCARIMTGAPLPRGADAVVPFEDVEEHDGRVSVRQPASVGACVRPEGNDLAAGTLVLEPGEEIDARKIGLLAALGRDRIEVVRRPRVAVLATGDELVPPGTPLHYGQIYNSNGPMLAAAVREAGGEPIDVEAADDSPDAIKSALRSVGDVDLLLTSGGASVGDFDYVKDVVGESGEISFWRVAIRPGKPILFGFLGGHPLVGLPGNPTSAMVTFEEFVRPAIRRMLGAQSEPAQITAVAGSTFDNRGGRRTYARVRLSKDGDIVRAYPAGPQDSAMLLTLARADGLLVIPEDKAELKAGESAIVQVWRLPGDGALFHS